MKVFALPIKLVPINKTTENNTWQTAKNSLSDVLQSASVKRLLNQPNLVVKTIPANSISKFTNNKFGNKTNNTGISDNKSQLPELSVVPVKDEQSALDEEEDMHLLPSKIENKKSEIALFPLKRKRKACGHYEDCENIICDVTIQQYVENGRVSPILARSIEEDEISAPLGRHCENEKCDALNIDHNRCRRAAVMLNRCDRTSECDICGVQLQGWRARLYHKNCKRKNEYKHNNVSKMELQRERMRERELQILEHAKFRKTDYSDPDKVMETLQNNEELLIIPKTVPVIRQYSILPKQLAAQVTSAPGTQSTSSASNVQSVNISSIYENNRKTVTGSVSFSMAPHNAITMVNPRNTVMMNPQNAIIVKPQKTIIVKPNNAITVKPRNTIISGTLLPIESNGSSVNQVRIANLQQQNYVTTPALPGAATTAVNAPINSLSFVANVSTPGVASVTPSVVVVTTPITNSVNSVTVVAAPGSVAATPATTVATSTTANTLAIPTVPASGAAPMVRIPILQNATVQPMSNWIVAGSQIQPVMSTPQVQPVFRLMPITNLITPPSLLHRTQGIPKFCIMTIPTTSADAVVPSTTVTASGSIKVAEAPVKAALASTATGAPSVTRTARDTQPRIREIQPKGGRGRRPLRFRNKQLDARDGGLPAPPSKTKKANFCTICKRFIKTWWYYKIHLDKHRMLNDLPNVNSEPYYYCFICSIHFKTERDFMKHSFDRHNGRTIKTRRAPNKAKSTADKAGVKTRKRKLALSEDDRNHTTAKRDVRDAKKGKLEDTSSDTSEIEEVNNGPAQNDDDDDGVSLESANADEQTDQEPATFNDKHKEVDGFSFVTVKEEIDSIKSEGEDIPNMSEDEAYFDSLTVPSSDPLNTNTCTICKKYVHSSKTVCTNCESVNSEFSFESCS